MSIEVLEDLNAQACCCDLTLCPVPAVVCQSVGFTKQANLEPTQEEIDAFDGSFDLFAPFTEPDGSPEDDLPIIYRKKSGPRIDPPDSSIRYNGSGWDYIADYSEVNLLASTNHLTVNHVNYDGGNFFDGTGISITAEYDAEGNVIYSTTQEGAGREHPGLIPGVWWFADIYEPPGFTGWDVQSTRGWDCSATRRSFTGEIRHTSYGSPTAPPPPSLPGPWGNSYTAGGDFTATDPSDYVELSDGITKSELIAEARAGLPTEWPEPAEDSDCVSFLGFDWPTIADATPVGGWPTCEDSGPPEIISASASAGKSRVRFQIPNTWTDQVTGLTVTFTGTYFKITYDILEEPDGWNAEPPTALRSYVSVDNVVTWTGPGTGAPDDPSWFTDWITLDPPAAPGTRRIVNIRFVCRENWFIGEVPQVTGDGVDLTPPEADVSSPETSFIVPLL